MARLPEFTRGGVVPAQKIRKPMKRFQTGGETAEEQETTTPPVYNQYPGTAGQNLPTTVGGAGTAGVQQTGETTGFPSAAVTHTTEEKVADAPTARPISGILPSQKVGLTEGEMITPVATALKTDELVQFGQTNQTELPSDPIVTTAGAIAKDVSAPTITSANTYAAYTQQNTPEAAAVTGSVSPTSLIGDPTEFAKTAVLKGEVSEESVAGQVAGTVSNLGTVKGQIESLFAAINEGEALPAWAAPAVRKVSAMMQQRGLGASSMAAAAITQAIYESAIPIAAQDAKTYAAVDLQNLNNQQTTTLQNAMTYAAMDKANMSGRLAASVDNAKAFLSMDVKNMDNTQRTNEINHQTNVQKMLTEISQENASRQFNAKSQNEVDEFFEELGAQIGNSNNNRAASISQVNADQANAMQRFQSQMQDSRDKFDTNMASQILQNNAQWRREINTRDTAVQNETNRINAQALLGLTTQSHANLWQRYRDEAMWVMQASESRLQRAHQSAMIAQETEANTEFYDKQFKDNIAMQVGQGAFNLLLGGLSTPPPLPSSGGPLSSTAGGGGSDIRFKTDIIQVGKSPSGINVYEWRYIWDDAQRYRGVMAQEVIHINPLAVISDKLGYFKVRYDLLDVNMEAV